MTMSEIPGTTSDVTKETIPLDDHSLCGFAAGLYGVIHMEFRITPQEWIALLRPEIIKLLAVHYSHSALGEEAKLWISRQ